MNDELIKKTFEEMKKKLPKAGTCPDEDDILRFAEGVMDREEAETIKQHFLVCTKCSDDYVSLFATLDKVATFSEGESFAKVSSKQIKQVCDMVPDRKKIIHERTAETLLDRLGQSVRDFFTFSWLAQPIPIVIKSGVTILVVLFIFIFIYYPNQMKYHSVSRKISEMDVPSPPQSVGTLEGIEKNPVLEEKGLDQKARSPILRKSTVEKSAGKESIASYYKKGVQYFESEDYTNAKAEWKKTLEIDPNYQPSKKGLERINTKIEELYQSGMKSFKEENFSLATEQWEKVAKYDPDFKNVSDYLKRAYKMQERLETLEKRTSREEELDL